MLQQLNSLVDNMTWHTFSKTLFFDLFSFFVFALYKLPFKLLPAIQSLLRLSIVCLILFFIKFFCFLCNFHILFNIFFRLAITASYFVYTSINDSDFPCCSLFGKNIRSSFVCFLRSSLFRCRACSTHINRLLLVAFWKNKIKQNTTLHLCNSA